jgi:hypothetical protein
MPKPRAVAQATGLSSLDPFNMDSLSLSILTTPVIHFDHPPLSILTSPSLGTRIQLPKLEAVHRINLVVVGAEIPESAEPIKYVAIAGLL